MGRKTTTCISIAVAMAALAMIFLILYFTILKPKNPVIIINSISISHLRFRINLPKIRAHLNLTLNAAATIRNPNRAAFDYSHTTAYLRYRGKDDIGEAPIAAGSVAGRGSSRRLNLTLAVMAERLMANRDFYPDAISGRLPLRAEVRIEGRVRAVVGAKVAAYAACDVEVHLVSRSLVNHTCHYKIKL